jgi:hypothetical protein
MKWMVDGASARHVESERTAGSLTTLCGRVKRGCTCGLIREIGNRSRLELNVLYL